MSFNTEEEAIRDGKIKFKKPTKKGEDEVQTEESEQAAESTKGKEKKKGKRKQEKQRKKPSLLSFDDEEEEEDGWFVLVCRMRNYFMYYLTCH